MQSRLQQAFLAPSLSALENFPEKADILYFGQEFCDRLLPSKKELLQAKQFCERQGLKFSFVTPYLTENGLKHAISLSGLLSQEDELVVNDFGLLYAAMRKFPKPALVAGRILNRQYRDPRIASFKGAVPEQFTQHLQLSSAASGMFQKFLKEHSVERAELDNLKQGISTDLSKSGIKGSIHVPFVFVATGRMCLSANSDKISFHKTVGVLPCSKECQRYQFQLQNTLFNERLFLFGNTVFFKNAKLDEKGLLQKGIDRLVTNKALQSTG